MATCDCWASVYQIAVGYCIIATVVDCWPASRTHQEVFDTRSRDIAGGYLHENHQLSAGETVAAGFGHTVNMTSIVRRELAQ